MTAIWPYVIVCGLTFGDAFLSLLPNETALTAFAALAVSTGTPNIVALAGAAAASAVVGDALTYLIGRKVGVSRYGWMRSYRAELAVEWARNSLDRRAGPVIIVARYIPFGKFAVSLTAGATRFRFGRYLPRVILSCTIWAIYHSLIGVAFGAWLRTNPLLAVIVASASGIVLGLAIDRLSARLERRRTVRAKSTPLN